MAISLSSISSPYVTTQWNGSSFSNTQSVTVPAGAGYLIVRVSHSSARAATVTLDGDSLTKSIFQTDENTRLTAIYEIKNPPEGTFDLIIDSGGSQTSIQMVIDVVIGGGSYTTGFSRGFISSSSVTADTISGDLVLDAISTEQTTTAGSGQTTQIVDQNNMSASSKTATSGTTTMSWTHTADWTSHTYIAIAEAVSEFTLSATPTFNQTITITTTDWGAEDPTSVDITDSAANTITLSLTATGTADEYTFTMPTISETEGTSISGLLSGSGTIRVYSATGDDVTKDTTISYGAVWENVATLSSGFNTEPTSQLTPLPVAGDQLAGQAEVEPLANGNINADQGVFPILHIQASTGTIYTQAIDTTQIGPAIGLNLRYLRSFSVSNLRIGL